MTKTEEKFLKSIVTGEGGTFPTRVADSLMKAGLITPRAGSIGPFIAGRPFQSAGAYELTGAWPKELRA